jgi:hypothetical protein
LAKVTRRVFENHIVALPPWSGADRAPAPQSILINYGVIRVSVGLVSVVLKFPNVERGNLAIDAGAPPQPGCKYRRAAAGKSASVQISVYMLAKFLVSCIIRNRAMLVEYNLDLHAA